MNGTVTKLYDIDSILIPEELLDLRVEDSEIEEKVNMLSLRYADENETDVVAEGDIVYCKADKSSYPDGRSIILFTNTQLPGAEDASKKAIGKNVNDSFEAVLSEKKVTLTVEKIIRRSPAEVNDNLVGRIGIDGVTTLDEYRSYLREQMLSDIRMERHKAIFYHFLCELEKNSEYSYDEKEVQEYIKNLIAQYPPVDDMSSEEVEANVFSQLKETWISEAFCKEHNIEIDMKEIEEAVDQMMGMQALLGDELPEKEELVEMYIQNARFGALYEYVDKISTEKLGG